MGTTAQLAANIGNKSLACEVLVVSRASLHRWQHPAAPPPEPPAACTRSTPARALADVERRHVLDVLHEPRFVDKSPAAVYAELLDSNIYLCSIRTMYRILAGRGEVAERRAIRRHPPAHMPCLVATAPNHVWTWDITRLPGPVRGTFFPLYVILDLFSRFVVGWMLARHELAVLAQQLLVDSFAKHDIGPGRLVVHADRGAPMKSKSVAELYADMGVLASFSRPRVSDDNPQMESHFKTLKYHHTYPGRFGSPEDARAWCQPFFHWYNTEHRHSGIGLMTPEMVFTGRAPQVRALRREALLDGYMAHPERFVHGQPEPPRLPPEVWINRPVGPLIEPGALH